MKSILIVGCGDVALRLIPLLQKGYRVFALIRQPDKAVLMRSLGAIPVIADLDDRRSLQRISGLADIVFHFAPPTQTSGGDPRTRFLLAALSRGRRPSQLIYISTSGVYGDCSGDYVAETRKCNPQSARSQRRVAAERMIRAWARRVSVNVSILRVPGIYAVDRLPLPRLQQQTPCVVDEQDSYTNHIHADDLARVARACLFHPYSCRIYHVSDNSELKMGAYFDLVADAFALPRPPRLTRDEAGRVLPPILWSFMNESRRLLNERMLKELKVQLLYPTVSSFLKKIRGNDE